MQFSQLKKNDFEEPYLDLEMFCISIKAQIEGLDIRYLYIIIGDLYFTLGL